MKLTATILSLFQFMFTYAQQGWNDITPPGSYSGLFGVYAVNSDNVWVVGGDGTMLNTSDGGINWNEMNCPVTYPLYNVHFINADTGFVGGDNASITELMRTTDGGLSWDMQVLYNASDLGNYDIEFIEGAAGEPQRGFVTAGLSLVWMTDDYGQNRESTGINGGCGANSLRSICFINKDEGWFVGEPSATTDVTILRTTDGGQTYIIQTNPTDPDIRLNSVSFATDQQGVAVGNAGTILYTSDGGQNWEIRSYNSIRWQSVFMTQSGKAWAAGANGTIGYSTDWGYTWTAQQSGVTCELWEVVFINDEEGWIAGGGMGQPGVILHTTSGGVITDVKENNIVRKFELHQNYPNPFNPSTTIMCQIPEPGSVTLKVYDVLGREVATLINKELNAGRHEITFDASVINSGVYFYQLSTGNYVQVKKMILMK